MIGESFFKKPLTAAETVTYSHRLMSNIVTESVTEQKPEIDWDAEEQAEALKEQVEMEEISSFAAELPPAPSNDALWDLQKQIAGEVLPKIVKRQRAWAQLPD